MKKQPARQRNRFRAAKEVRKLARERIGAVPPGRVIEPKPRRKAAKHPLKELERELEA
ncbi:MAG TPA: hypothetical protein VFA54_16160 [Bryobacterales bacterium]|jgi:hypothetical protein|nr:hypothetical protein [Bryobacterales bacterium]